MEQCGTERRTLEDDDEGTYEVETGGRHHSRLGLAAHGRTTSFPYGRSGLPFGGNDYYEHFYPEDSGERAETPGSDTLVGMECGRAACRTDSTSSGGDRERGRNDPYRNPTLRRPDPSITIRQHYYPEGGWGWLICACAFVVHLVTFGLQLSYGVLYVEVIREFGQEYLMEAVWIGALSTSSGLFLSPIIVAFCRRKSTRLTAVFGGLVSALGCLFTSFASQLHQVFLSYGVVMGFGLGIARETSSLMIGQYFKRRRECVELIVQSGTGIGITIFSVFLREVMRTLGWRLGLQTAAGVVFLTFFLGICYRSASLYHPQRRAILHLKNQRKKIKEKNPPKNNKPPFFDFTALRVGALRIIMMSTFLSSFGVYTPLFYMVYIGEEEGLQQSSIILLQTFMGFAIALGCSTFGLLVVRSSAKCMIARQYLCQAAMFGIGVAILSFRAVDGYHGYVLFVWFYGIFCGGFQYSLKMFVFEKVRARNFGRAWGFVQWSQVVPVLVGVPVTGYINASKGPKTGFYFSAGCAFLGAASLFLMNLRSRVASSKHVCLESPHLGDMDPSSHEHELNDAGMLVDSPLCACGNTILPPTEVPSPGQCQKTLSFEPLEDLRRQDQLTRISEEALLEIGDPALDDWYPPECMASFDREVTFEGVDVVENDLRSTFPRPKRLRLPFRKVPERDCPTPPPLKSPPGCVRPPRNTMTIIEEVTSTV